jgi:hypothetical protein
MAACEDSRAEGCRKSACLPVRIQDATGASLGCLLTHLSLSGLMLEPEADACGDSRPFQDFFARLDRRPVVVDISPTGAPGLKLTARRAFAEETPDHRLRQVGLALWLVDEELADLKALIGRVA